MSRTGRPFRCGWTAGRYWALIAVAFLVIPLVINDYWANAVLVPFLIYAIAALGLNILTGYCGQVSLGTGGFMAVGAYAGLQADDRVSRVHLPSMSCWRG